MCPQDLSDHQVSLEHLAEQVLLDQEVYQDLLVPRDLPDYADLRAFPAAQVVQDLAELLDQQVHLDLLALRVLLVHLVSQVCFVSWYQFGMNRMYS